MINIPSNVPPALSGNSGPHVQSSGYDWTQMSGNTNCRCTAPIQCCAAAQLRGTIEYDIQYAFSESKFRMVRFRLLCGRKTSLIVFLSRL